MLRDMLICTLYIIFFLSFKWYITNKLNINNKKSIFITILSHLILLENIIKLIVIITFKYIYEMKVNKIISKRVEQRRKIIITIFIIFFSFLFTIFIIIFFFSFLHNMLDSISKILQKYYLTFLTERFYQKIACDYFKTFN